MKIPSTILITLLLLTSCAADIHLSMNNSEECEVEVDYNSARRAAISMSCQGATVLTGEVITDDPAAIVEALGSAAAPLKDD